MSEELKLLRKVAEAANDYVMGSHDQEFADLNGGIECLGDTMSAAVQRYNAFLSEAQDCRDSAA